MKVKRRRLNFDLPRRRKRLARASHNPAGREAPAGFLITASIKTKSASLNPNPKRVRLPSTKSVNRNFFGLEAWACAKRKNFGWFSWCAFLWFFLLHKQKIRTNKKKQKTPPSDRVLYYEKSIILFFHEMGSIMNVIKKKRKRLIVVVSVFGISINT